MTQWLTCWTHNLKVIHSNLTAAICLFTGKLQPCLKFKFADIGGVILFVLVHTIS